MNLIDYGFIPTMMPDNESGLPARVTAVHKERYALVCEHGECYGRLKGSVYYGSGPARGAAEDYPTAGDFVLILYNPSGDSVIYKTLPRRSKFSRSDNAGHAEGYAKTIKEQMVAANFDYVFILSSLNQDFNLRRIERYLALAWRSGAVPVLVLTKADLAGDYTAQVRAAEKAAPGVGVYPVSAKTGEGLGALSEYLKPKKTIVLLGSSGVGKSSLVNALAGQELMAVREIREDDSRGRHTTTRRQLLMLKCGVMVIDTPGMRELGMWDVSDGLGGAFEDVAQYISQCRFSDCEHQIEPGCAVRAALQEGALSQDRWNSYLSLQREARYVDDKAGVQRERRKKGKEIALYTKQLKKTDYRHAACTESFTCKVCGRLIVPEGAGSRHRNHCPRCLSSVHVDDTPGDRASLCGGVMDPIGVWVRRSGEWAVIHRCRSCGALRANRIAADDNPTLLMSIAVKPLAVPPFPLELLEDNLDDGK